MQTTLSLSVSEFDWMVECGAFMHLNRKVELIRGELRQMNPAGPLHDGLITYLNSWSARSTPDDVAVTSQTGLSLPAQMSRPEPDLMWLQAGRYLARHPTAEDVVLAMEVAYSSLKSDLLEKAALYAEAGIVEYWIVDANSSCIHVCRHPVDGQYTDRQVAKPGDQLGSLAYPDIVLDVRDLFVAE